MQGLVYILIALAAVGVAAAAYFGLTFSPIESLVTAMGFAAIAVVLMERTLRRRSEARMEKAVEDLARLLSTDAKAGQVLSQRVNAIADTNVGGRLEAIEADISVLGTVVRQLAEALAEFEEAQKGGKPADPKPAQPAPHDEDVLPDPLVPEAELRIGLETNRLVFHIEPMVGLPSRRASGYDLVPRLMRADGELADAPDFMPRRGGADLVRRIEAMALEEAVTIVRRARTAGQPTRLGLVISRATILDKVAFDEVLAILGANQAIAPSLTFIVAQSEWKALGPAQRRNLLEIGKLGATFSMAETGTLRMDYAELQSIGFATVRFDATRFLRNPEAYTDFHSADVVPYVQRFSIELCATGVIDEQQLLGLFEDGITLMQGPHIGRPGPVRADLLVERAPEERRIGAQA